MRFSRVCALIGLIELAGSKSRSELGTLPAKVIMGVEEGAVPSGLHWKQAAGAVQGESKSKSHATLSQSQAFNRLCLLLTFQNVLF